MNSLWRVHGKSLVTKKLCSFIFFFTERNLSFNPIFIWTFWSVLFFFFKLAYISDEAIWKQEKQDTSLNGGKTFWANAGYSRYISNLPNSKSDNTKTFLMGQRKHLLLSGQVGMGPWKCSRAPHGKFKCMGQWLWDFMNNICWKSNKFVWEAAGVGKYNFGSADVHASEILVSTVGWEHEHKGTLK